MRPRTNLSGDRSNIAELSRFDSFQYGGLLPSASGISKIKILTANRVNGVNAYRGDRLNHGRNVAI